MAKENLPVVHVINGRQKKLLQGHPWVYGNEIERVEGEIVDGDLVTVVDFRGRYMGTGFYNSRSLITVRLLTHQERIGEVARMLGGADGSEESARSHAAHMLDVALQIRSV